ncbi:hypothetical protein K490DRAFT_61602 [Saccharata proteae CBS 121410]|uniref:Uncharacterized protein n=1 Tax=Saccharata proteae CBS 121410 TaxID=1314787 RepID=A0A9P4M2D0_9PEZI|nr:hypothetical protein K490DRAFT_61602 [Saccharata proteae CBS 121410]
MSSQSVDRAAAQRPTATPSKSPMRRALGELTPNAKISQQSHGNAATDKQPALSPLKQSQTVSLMRDENNQPHHTAPAQVHGRKRSIDELDGSAARQDAREVPNKRHEIHTEPATRRDTMANPEQTPANSTRHLLEVCNEDCSSTDEDSQDHPPRVSQNTIGSKASFSSLIDYNPSSSQPASSSPLVPASTSCARTQAETLRLRLRVAFFKVKTDQTSVPLSRLEIPDRYQRKCASRSATTSPNSASASGPSQSAQNIPTIQISPSKPSEERASSMPKLLPAPILRPTAYSSRMINEPSLPSSPPESNGVDDEETPKGREEFETPTGNKHEAAQLSSPPGSGERGRQNSLTESQGDSDALTSSVVKGRAASGLLELMRSA